jgi:D-alanyl-D-alanine dipeptidase
MTSRLEAISANSSFVNLRSIEGVKIDLKYATTQNFMNQNVYGDFREAFLHREAAAMLVRAISALRREHPGYSLLIFDALRPRSAQRVLWDHVKGTDQERYVANPDRGSLHNYGCAVDLTVTNLAGEELDMGTGFDVFLPLSQPQLEEQFLASGELKAEHHENRLILRSAMQAGGFRQLSHEWWHYDAFPGDEVRARFQIVE